MKTLADFISELEAAAASQGRESRKIQVVMSDESDPTIEWYDMDEEDPVWVIS